MVGVVDCVENLRLDGIEVCEVRVQSLQLRVVHGRLWQWLQVQQVCMRRMALGQNKVLQTNGNMIPREGKYMLWAISLRGYTGHGNTSIPGYRSNSSAQEQRPAAIRSRVRSQ